MSMNDNYKIYGAVLGTALLAMGLNEVAGAVYHTSHPDKPGMLIEVAETAEGGEAGGGAAEEAKPLADLLKTADLARGQTVAKACAACHDFTKGGPNKVGPNLWDIIGRNHAAVAGFPYSEGFKAKAAEAWTFEALDAFLTAPKAAVPGTKMAYGGLKSGAKRADLLAYLQSLSDSPKPFPAQ